MAAGAVERGDPGAPALEELYRTRVEAVVVDTRSGGRRRQGRGRPRQLNAESPRRFQRVFIAKNEGATDSIVLDVSGKGLWSIQGYRPGR